MITNYFFFFLFYQGFSLTATYDKDLSNGNGGVILNYTEFGSDSGTTFSHFIMKRIYDQVPEWNPISAMNFVKGDKVKVLNYYPVADFVDQWHQMKYVDFTYTDGSPAKSNHLKSDSMKVWMEGGTIGGEVYEPVGEIEIDGTKEKLLYVDSEPMTSFNTNPQKIFDYDVIVFGTWDTNYADYDMSKRTNLPIPASIEVLKNYLDQGFGVLFGHDTLGFVFGKKDSFGPLQDYVKLKFGRWGSYPASADNRDYDEVSQFWTVQTVIKKEGLLTKYPWDIGPIGTVLNISLTHTCAQTAFGDIWLEMGELYHDPIDGPYSDIAAPEEVGGNYKFYLTSHKNAAMMQTGHSNCESTHDERKIIANTLFYLKQRSSATSLIDNEAYDREPPGKPELKSLTFSNDGKAIIMFDAIDYGTKYGYQVFAYLLPNDVSDHSSSEQVYVTTTPSGVKGYYYRIDNNPEESTEDFSDDFTFITNGEIKLDNIAGTSCYIHVYAIDNSGNIGDESVFPIKFATTEFTSVNYLNSRNFRNLGFYLVPFLLEAQL